MERIELTFENVEQYRLRIYKKALEIFLEEDITGLCNCIKSALFDLGFRSCPFQANMEKYFPELWTYKPENCGLYELWWPRNEIKERTRVLNEIINTLKDG